MGALIIIPAIDIRGGAAVRLHQGDYAQETVFDADPVDAARRWLDQGASRLHVVDLDGARDGAPAHLSIVRRICAAAGDVPVQLGGGLRTENDLSAARDAGVAYVIVGTAALESAEFLSALCSAHPVLVGVDARDGKVAIRGWLETSQATAEEVARRAAEAGAVGVIHTDIARDGAGSGPHLAATARVAQACGLDVIVSGGVGGVDHVREAAAARSFAGIIIGRALYDGRLTLKAATAAAAAAGAPRC